MSEYNGNEQNGTSVGLVEKQTFIFAQPPDTLALEGGADIGPVTLAYETCGTMNSDKSNVILVLHALSGEQEGQLTRPIRTAVIDVG